MHRYTNQWVSLYLKRIKCSPYLYVFLTDVSGILNMTGIADTRHTAMATIEGNRNGNLANTPVSENVSGYLLTGSARKPERTKENY